MRIVSWNMNYCMRSVSARQQAWAYLRDELRADVALVQEAVPLADMVAEYRQTHATHPRYRWGTAVVALRPGLTLQPYKWVPLAESHMKPPPALHLPESHPGACAVAEVHDPSGRCLFTAVSFYAQWEYRPGSKSLHACTRAQRILSDLTGVLATSRRRPVVLAGDFNLTTQGAMQSAYKDASNAAAAVFARLEAWGMVDCLKHTRPADAPRLADCDCNEGDACTHVVTFRNKGAWKPQLDYAFASAGLARALGPCHPVNDDVAWALSDHCPLVVEIDDRRL